MTMKKLIEKIADITYVVCEIVYIILIWMIVISFFSLVIYAILHYLNH